MKISKNPHKQKKKAVIWALCK